MRFLGCQVKSAFVISVPMYMFQLFFKLENKFQISSSNKLDNVSKIVN